MENGGIIPEVSYSIQIGSAILPTQWQITFQKNDFIIYNWEKMVSMVFRKPLLENC